MPMKVFICLLILLFPAATGNAIENRNSTDKVIIVGGNGSYPPYEFFDMAGKPAGFVVELTKAIADVMGFQVIIKLDKSGQICAKN